MADACPFGTFLERNGVIEDWLEESLVFDVLESIYFGRPKSEKGADSIPRF
jgi:hypothetical protein